MTPSEVRRRYSKGRVFEVVFKNGYKKRGIWARRLRSVSVRREEAQRGAERVTGAHVPFKKS